MKKSNFLLSLKLLVSLFVFVQISTCLLGSAQANTVTADDKSEVKSSEVKETEPIDVNSIMSALKDKKLKDGDSYIVDNKYEAKIKITMEKVSGTGIQLMSVTSDYYALCSISIYHLGSSVCVAQVNHTITLTYNDSGLVHINSGTLSINPLVLYVSVYAYGYSITNTDGTYSYATGMVRIYDSTAGYYYYGCGVSVNRGSLPSFSFTPVN